MARLPVLITVLLLSILPVPGCLFESSPPESDTGRITLVFKHGKISGDPRPLQRLLSEFEARHPAILVHDEALPSSTDQQHQIYAINLEGGAGGIDVLAMDVIWVPEFSRAGWIRPVDDYFNSEVQEQFLSNAIQAVSYRGRVWAVPWNIDAGVFYYRKDLLEKYHRPPPATWSELVETTRIVLAGEQDPRLYGFIWQGRQYEGLICNALEFIWGNGGDIAVSDTGLGDVAQSANQQALTFMRDLIHKNGVSPLLVLTGDEETSRHLFGNGRAIFTRNWPYAWTLFERTGSPVRGKVGLRPLPTFGGHPAASTLGGWNLGITRESRHPEAAWQLIEFLTSEEAQRSLAIAVGMEPTRRALYQDHALLAANPILPELATIVAAARPRPVTPFYLGVSEVLQSEFSAILGGVRAPEVALRSADREISHMLQGSGS